MGGEVHDPMLGETAALGQVFHHSIGDPSIGYFPNLARYVEACANVHTRVRRSTLLTNRLALRLPGHWVAGQGEE